MTEQAIECIQSRIDTGDEYLNSDDFDRALAQYQDAASLIPEPKVDHPVALGVYLAIGEAFIFLRRYAEAIRAIQTAAKSPGGIENPPRSFPSWALRVKGLRPCRGRVCSDLHA